MINAFFNYVDDGTIKVRIMFTNNYWEPTGLSRKHIEDKYFLLYYQFIKHAFGLRYMGAKEQVGLNIFLDKLPDTIGRCQEFKDHIYLLQRTHFEGKIVINKEDISEIRNPSKHHLIQCLDIVTGSMGFRLNKMHLAKIPGMNKRAKKTIAKEEVYKAIQKRITLVKPRFNIGISTGMKEGYKSLWSDKYRHWLFIPKQHVINKK